MTASVSPASAGPSPSPPCLRAFAGLHPSSEVSRTEREDAPAASGTAASPHVSVSAMAPLSLGGVEDVLHGQLTREILHGSMTPKDFLPSDSVTPRLLRCMVVFFSEHLRPESPSSSFCWYAVLTIEVKISSHVNYYFRHSMIPVFKI